MVRRILWSSSRAKISSRSTKPTWGPRQNLERGIFSLVHKVMNSGNQRHFCPECGSHLYAYDERWPQWIYPYPSCIDTPLPKPPKYVYMCLDSKVSWVEVPKGGQHCKHYPDKGLEEWHKANGCFYGDEEEEDKPKAKKAKTEKTK